MIHIENDSEGRVVLTKFNDDKMMNLLPLILKQVEVIGEEAFAENLDLISIFIPDNVKEIGRGAFRGCPRLTQIKLPTKLEIIEDEVFKDCTALPNIELPSTVKTIGTSAFENCKYLSEINFPKRLAIIGVNAFRFCDNLREIDLPDNVELGGGAFYNSGLTIIEIPKNARLKDSYVFASSDLCEARILSGTFIPQGTFADCRLLERVELPNGLQIIQGNAFKGCVRLCEIELPSTVRMICFQAFKDSHISTINFPNSLEKIGSQAFKGCKCLTKVTLPHDDIELKEEAFEIGIEIKYIQQNKRIFNYLLEKIESNNDLKDKDKRHITSLIKYIIESSLSHSEQTQSAGNNRELVVDDQGQLVESEISASQEEDLSTNQSLGITSLEDENSQAQTYKEDSDLKEYTEDDELVRKLRAIVEKYRQQNTNNDDNTFEK